jgi:H+/Cl- antiporter ClcA
MAPIAVAVTAATIGVVSGLASALFLWLLDLATAARTPLLVLALPLAGVALGAAQDRWAKPVLRGTNLVIDTLRDGGPPLPRRMAPVVLVGTVLTHLFGGSAGREGTAVQMGAGLADGLAQQFAAGWPPLHAHRRLLLATGVAAGFGAVFGTPVAGAVFALEFTGTNEADRPAPPALAALGAALLAAVVGDQTCRAVGTVHTAYPAVAALPLGPVVLAKWAVFGVVVGLVARGFVALTRAVQRLGDGWGRAVRMGAGGAAITALWALTDGDAYLGLGVPTIVRAFTDEGLPTWTFLAKLVFTAITVGSGFLGGEVTPLFFVGATLGNPLARALGLPVAIGAGVGMAAMFGAPSHTPIALSIMAAELMGAPVLAHALLVSVIASAVTGRRTLYEAQRRS